MQSMGHVRAQPGCLHMSAMCVRRTWAYTSLTPRKVAPSLANRAAWRLAHWCTGALAHHQVYVLAPVKPGHDELVQWLCVSGMQDAEIVIHAPTLTSRSLAAVLNAALRTVIDDLDCPCFNVAVQPMWEDRPPAQQPFANSRVIARCVS